MPEIMLARRVRDRLGPPFGVNAYPNTFPNRVAERFGPKAVVVDVFHDADVWGSGECHSGVGSELAFTENYAPASCLADHHRILSLFDIPCGDLSWMSLFLCGNSIAYAEGDLSAEVVARVRGTHPAQNQRDFEVISDPYPEAESWHCRDQLFHPFCETIQQALADFAAAGVGYALIISHRAHLLHRNLDVGFEGFCFADLERAHFSLPKPLERIPDFRWGRNFPRHVCHRSREQIVQVVTRWPQP